MLKPRGAALIFSAGLAIAGASAAFCQEYPSKPIRIIASEPGGGQDFVARLIAQGITAPMGQPVIVDNRPSNIAVEVVAKAAPDGYTLLLSGSSFTATPLLRETSYDPVKDFAPVIAVDRAPSILVVHPSLPVKSVRELIALAKAKPGALNYGAANVGSSPQLAAELFKFMAGVQITGIPYKGSAPALNDLLGGQTQVMFPTAGSVAPQIKSGRLRAVAVTTLEPSLLAPGLPTVAASGLPDYEVQAIHGVVVPARTPAAIVRRLNQAIMRVVNQPDVKQKFFDAGVESVGNSPEEYGDQIKGELIRMGKVIKSAGIRVP
jgi:tripartite-type tricarboxylate transporter receptor subunit TctC